MSFAPIPGIFLAAGDDRTRWMARPQPSETFTTWLPATFDALGVSTLNDVPTGHEWHDEVLGHRRDCKIQGSWYARPMADLDIRPYGSGSAGHLLLLEDFEATAASTRKALSS